MNKNYGRSNRVTANARKAVGVRKSGAQARSHHSAGRAARGSVRRGPQPKQNNSKNVVIGVIIGCVAIVLVVLVVAMNSDSGANLEEKYTGKEPGKHNANTERGKSIADESETTHVDDVVKKDTKKPENDKEEDLDDDPSWHEKDPNFKGEKLGNRKLNQ